MATLRVRGEERAERSVIRELQRHDGEIKRLWRRVLELEEQIRALRSMGTS